MEKNRFLKFTMVLIVVIGLTLLIKANVTLSKEPSSDEFGGKSNLALETNSDLVKNIYSKLTLLDDSLLSDNYKYAYFKMKENEKELSSEEKLYITIENLYSLGKFDLETDGDTETTKVNADYVIDEANTLFKGDNLDAKNITFVPSTKCGVTDYLYTGTEYQFTFTKCDEHQDITRTELQSARKDGNYIVLRVKSFYATYQAASKKEKEDHYVVANYNSEKDIIKISPDEIEERLPLITETYDVDEYEFYFELRGEDYYLSKIAKLKS